MECRRVGFAAPIFHIRWRLAGNRFASYARRSRRLTVCVRTPAFGSDPHISTTIISAFLTGFGLLLIPGLWTPLVGALVALLEILQIMTIAGDRWSRFCWEPSAALSPC